jgi:lipid-A-disaccharide synthase
MRVFVSLGERSASNYIYHIFKEVKGIDFYGITDERLESIGFKSLAKIEDLSVVGITEALPKVPFVFQLWRQIERLMPEFDAIILCDAPAFNLPLLRRIRGKVKKVIYFISPQVWAWKEGRAKVISEYADHLIVLLPFEVDFYRRYAREGFKVHFVGHPLLDLASPSIKEEDFKRLVGFEEYMALLPGSRWSEVKRHVPYLKEVIRGLDLPAVVPTFEAFKSYMEESFRGYPVRVITSADLENPSYNAMAYARLTLLASGTAELEASLLRSVHAVFYRVSPLTYLLGRLLIKVPYVALTNLILNRSAVPELIQRPPEELLMVARELLKEERRQEQLRSFEALRERFGGEGSLLRLRELFLQLLYEG